MTKDNNAQSIALGISAGLDAMGATLSGCTPSMLVTYVQQAIAAERSLEEKEMAAQSAREYVPPMWGLWIYDPSGKYGPHKVFAQNGETPEEAFKLAAASYRPDEGPISLLDDEHYVINKARGIKP